MSNNQLKINGGINFLRIIAMINIIGGHYYSHGAGFATQGVINKLIYSIGIINSGNVGATIFALISGWFLCDTEVSIGKWLKYVGEVLFYSYVGIAIAYLLNLDTFSFKNLIYSLFPISSSLYWYAGTFCIAYIFLPLIKLSCKSFRENKSTYNRLILVGLFAFFLIGTFTPVNHVVSTLSWMLFLFYFGDYLRFSFNQKNDDDKRIILNRLKIVLLVLIVITSVLRYCILIRFFDNQIVMYFEPPLLGRYSLLTLAISTCCIILFSEINCSSLFVNWLSKGTFGIYLLHDNYLLYSLIWFTLLKTDNYINSNIQFIHMLISVSLIFISGIVIDLIRRNTVERIWKKIINFVIIKLYNNKHISRLIEYTRTN